MVILAAPKQYYFTTMCNSLVLELSSLYQLPLKMVAFSYNNHIP